jgi:hypothetical protein
MSEEEIKKLQEQLKQLQKEKAAAEKASKEATEARIVAEKLAKDANEMVQDLAKQVETQRNNTDGKAVIDCGTEQYRILSSPKAKVIVAGNTYVIGELTADNKDVLDLLIRTKSGHVELVNENVNPTN